MPDANGNLKPISLSGKAGEAWERIFGQKAVKVTDYPKRDRSAEVYDAK